jgi:hypothetical protein
MSAGLIGNFQSTFDLEVGYRPLYPCVEEAGRLGGIQERVLATVQFAGLMPEGEQVDFGQGAKYLAWMRLSRIPVLMYLVEVVLEFEEDAPDYKSFGLVVATNGQGTKADYVALLIGDLT